MIIWILIILSLYLFYKWGTSTFDYFEKKGVPFNKPKFFVGSRLSMITSSESMVAFLTRIYNEFKNEKISGLFEFRYPAFFVRDPELIKRLAIKEFDNFTDRRMIIDEEVEPIFAKTVFGMKGQKWKDMRATLSPTFTGSKMRLMFKLINQVGSQMTSTVLKQFKAGAKNEVEFKEFARKFTTDIIGSTAFGLEINSLENPNNDFLRIATKASDFNNLSTFIKLIGFFISPKLMAILKVKFFDEETHTFFTYAVKEIFKSREKTGMIRHDMIDLMIQATKGHLQHDHENENEKSNDNGNNSFATVEEHDIGRAKVKRDWSDDEITAQCFIFFFAGFETVSTAMTFLAYELVRNPDIQDKLRAEIDEVNESLKGEDLNYEALHKMKYLDQVITESLRLHPPVPIVDRICTKDFTLDYDGKKIEFETGRSFYIPIYSIHHDPQYYPDPEKFDPERFSDENKHKVSQDWFMPFGVGPRNCIGNRFALMEVKALTYHLLLNFKFEATKNTQIPLKYVKSQALFQIEGGLHMALIPRK